MASETDSSRKCVTCGTTSRSGEGYLTRRGRSYCPVCNQRRMAKWARWSMLAIPLGMLCSWRLTSSRLVPNSQLGWAGVNFYWYIVFGFMVVLPHELGHALSARLLGCRIFQVSVGIGPLLGKVPFLGGTLLLHGYPHGGHTIALDNREKGFRMRAWIHVACGPLVNGLLMLAAVPYLTRPVHLKSLCQGWEPALDFAIANAVLLISNLIPRKTTLKMGPGKTDGLHLLTIPFMKRKDLLNWLSVYYLAPASVEMSANRVDEAIRILREGRSAYPDALLIRHDLAVALLRQDKTEEARQEFLALSASADLQPQVRLLCLNNIAAANIILGRPELIEEADRCSEEAMSSLGWHPSIQGTRGSVLVERGRLDEGIALARASMERHEDAKARSWSACTLALAFRRKGVEAEARKYLELAEKGGADGPRMQRIRALFADPPPIPTNSHNIRPEGSL